MKKILGVLAAIAMFCVFAPSAYADLNDGLVAYYPFNGNANDESGNGNDGAVYGASLVDDKFGYVDSAYYFDGLDDYIDVANSESLNITGPITLSLWIRSDRAGQTVGLNQFFVMKGDAYGLLIVNSDIPPDDDFIGLWLNRDIDPYTLTMSSQELLLNTLSPYEWYHVVGACDGTAMKIFLNGVHIADADNTFVGPIESLGRPLNIGRQFGGTRYFHGALDEIRIYNRALSQAEIQQLYDYSPDQPSWGASSTVGIENQQSTDSLNYLFVLILPVGVLLLWKTLRKGR